MGASCEEMEKTSMSVVADLRPDLCTNPLCPESSTDLALSKLKDGSSDPAPKRKRLWQEKQSGRSEKGAEWDRRTVNSQSKKLSQMGKAETCGRSSPSLSQCALI